MKPRRVTTQLDDDEYALLRAKARRDQRSVASILRELVLLARRDGYFDDHLAAREEETA